MYKIIKIIFEIKLVLLLLKKGFLRSYFPRTHFCMIRHSDRKKALMLSSKGANLLLKYAADIGITNMGLFFQACRKQDLETSILNPEDLGGQEKCVTGSEPLLRVHKSGMYQSVRVKPRVQWDP